MEWGNAVDVWSVGLLAWDLLESKSLFRVYDHESEKQNDAHHLATMTAILGPPPPEFLKRSKETRKYWNEDGKWKGVVPLPTEKTLESLANTLAGDERNQFVDFIQCLLCWLPEEHLTAGQAYYHPWLRERS